VNIIRKIKLEQLGYYKFTDSEKELVNFLIDNIQNLTISNNMFLKNDRVIFYHDSLHIKIPYTIWYKLQIEYKFNYNEINNVLKFFIYQYYESYFNINKIYFCSPFLLDY